MSAKYMLQLFSQKTGPWVFILFLFSVLFVPDFQIRQGLYIGAEEFLIPLMLIDLFFLTGKTDRRFILFISLFSAYILFTIIVNYSKQTSSDLFEIYKVLKFGIIVVYLTRVFNINKNLFHKVMTISLPVLLFVNLLHYFNVFGFNQTIEPYYALSEIHLKYFGYDSMGNPAVKRMLGTAGNPNINAIVFLFYLTYFLSKIETKKFSQASWSVLMATTGLVLCQSRTTMVAAAVIIVFAFIIRKFSWRTLCVNLLIILFAIFAAYLLSDSTFDYYSNTSFEPEENNSLVGRFQVWSYLFEMVLHKPLFGHGPSKQFFYQQTLYSDGEYILYLWRYGFIGLLFYISWILMPFFKNLKKALEHSFYLLLAAGILITAITNNPMSSTIILPLFAIAVAHFYAEITEESNSSQ